MIMLNGFVFLQEMFKLTTFDLVITVLQVVLIDFLRGVFVRYFNQCCCWDLERKFVRKNPNSIHPY